MCQEKKNEFEAIAKLIVSIGPVPELCVPICNIKDCMGSIINSNSKYCIFGHESKSLKPVQEYEIKSIQELKTELWKLTDNDWVFPEYDSNGLEGMDESFIVSKKGTFSTVKQYITENVYYVI